MVKDHRRKARLKEGRGDGRVEDQRWEAEGKAMIGNWAYYKAYLLCGSLVESRTNSFWDVLLRLVVWKEALRRGV
ncbi:hypothetical protein ACMFMG_007855 [Clarireedia jacksonii]